MDELNVYLQNHWAASAGGQDLARRVARSHRDTDVAPALDEVATGISEDRRTLGDLMRRLGLDPGVVTPTVVRAAERLGRLKPNGHVVRRSPASDVLELEALRGAVSTKRAGWGALIVLSADLARVPAAEVERLRDRADHQLERLAEVHRTLAGRRLAASGASDGGTL